MARPTGDRPQTILLRGCAHVQEEKEGKVALSPGQLVLIDSNDQYILNNTTAGEISRICVVMENDTGGQTIKDSYAATDHVKTIIPLPGHIVQLRVAARAPAIVIGDQVQLNGAGGVQKIVSGKKPIGTAVEAVDNSSGSSAAWIKVEIM